MVVAMGVVGLLFSHSGAVKVRQRCLSAVPNPYWTGLEWRPALK